MWDKTFDLKWFRLIFECKRDFGIIVFIPTIMYFAKGYDIGKFYPYTNITLSFLIFGITLQF